MLRNEWLGRATLLLALVPLGCAATTPSQSEDDLRASPPQENWERDVVSTALDVDLATKQATARIVLAPSSRRGASLEVGGLDIESVVDEAGKPVRHALHDGQLDLGLPARQQVEVTIRYGFEVHAGLEGLTKSGATFVWPSFCGNLFPCKSTPSDGLALSLEVRGAKKTVVHPESIPGDAPSYMLAWAEGDYTHVPLGETPAGTRVGVYYLPGEKAAALEGTEPLVDVFAWLEATYGAYTFGDEVASVSARWGDGAFGGMEHHPFWHVSSGSMSDRETHAHEATHGWFGNGVRIACWEDLVLSEGTTSYVTARALEATRGAAAGQAVWDDYEARLDAVIASEDRIAWPSSCDTIDVLRDLWNDVPYMKGAFFYRAVEEQVGREAMDRVLRRFYQEHVGGAAGMADVLATIEDETGFDPSALAEGWLRSKGRPDR